MIFENSKVIPLETALLMSFESPTKFYCSRYCALSFWGPPRIRSLAGHFWIEQACHHRLCQGCQFETGSCKDCTSALLALELPGSFPIAKLDSQKIAAAFACS